MNAEGIAIAQQWLLTTSFMGVPFVPVAVAVESDAPVADGDDASDEECSLASAQAEHQHRRNEARVESGQSRAGDSAAALERAQRLEALQALHDRDCPHCTRATGHTRTVFGEGSPSARLMFIGEAPGEEEDRTGRPFVGRAGQKLDEIIRAMGLQRSDVYIANVLKTRPPENRTPLSAEVECCAPFLRKQIEIIGPQVIVALGGPAAKMLLQTETGITRLRGQWGTYVDGDVRVPVMPTFHPAYLLRNYTPDTRKKVWTDMQAVIERLRSGGDGD